MVGHMDTVFAADTDFNDYREDDTQAYGPGVIDMKGGLGGGDLCPQGPFQPLIC
jgi:acetylornithine deacetylase/succinyl-diaminopimelate desuccinylase-like protein